MRYLVYLLLFILLGSCTVIRNTPKYGLQDGTYQMNHKKVFIETQNDTLLVTEENGKLNYNLPIVRFQDHSISNFQKSTFDIDVVAIPVKYRVSQAGLPNQLNSEINAALYLGKRKDYFQVSYDQAQSKRFKRKIDHYGFSVGGFAGIGNAQINTDVSQGKVAYEYQGITFTKGGAGFIAINNFTLGIAYGFDQLLDENVSHWIYNQKPWVGLALGFNLN
ncbi:hypothetical protein V7S79_08690 [Aquirufa sp. ROCK-SH2]